MEGFPPCRVVLVVDSQAPRHRLVAHPVFWRKQSLSGAHEGNGVGARHDCRSRTFPFAESQDGKPPHYLGRAMYRLCKTDANSRRGSVRGDEDVEKRAM